MYVSLNDQQRKMEFDNSSRLLLTNSTSFFH